MHKYIEEVLILKKKLSTKILLSTTVLSMAIAVGAVAYADSTIKKITAYQNSALKVKVDGQAIDLSSDEGTMYPIEYNGHSYVSAKALAEGLGATVKWNNSTQTVEVTSNSSTPSNAGIPDKDNSSNSTPSSTSPNTGSGSNSGSSSDSGSEASGGFVTKLSTEFDKDTVASQNKGQALSFFKAYAYAVKTGEFGRLDKFIDSSISTAPASKDSFWKGPSGTKEDLHEIIKNTRQKNKQSIINEWSDKIQNMSTSDVKIVYATKLSNIASFQYSVHPEGFDAFSEIDADFEFVVPYGSTGYWLTEINVY